VKNNLVLVNTKTTFIENKPYHLIAV